MLYIYSYFPKICVHMIFFYYISIYFIIILHRWIGIKTYFIHLGLIYCINIRTLRSCVSLNLLTAYRFLDRFKAHAIISITKIDTKIGEEEGGGGVMSKEDFGDGLSPLETLSKTICSVFKLHQENSSVPPTKQSSLYFNFLNDMPSPSNSNTIPVSIFVSD